MRKINNNKQTAPPKTKSAMAANTKIKTKPEPSWKGIHLPDETFYRFKEFANTMSLPYAKALEVLLDSHQKKKRSINKKKIG